MCKLDLEKASDHVNWNFLDYMMGRKGFGRKWRNWMKMCVRYISFSILVNGSYEGFFSSSRDKVIPLLYIGWV